MSESFPAMRNLKNRKLYMQVYDELRNYILKQQLKPGDMLPTEMEMCDTLGVSRNVLREAIKALEITGVVSSKPGVGIIIQEFNPDFLFQTLFYNLTSDSEALLNQTMEIRRILELGFLDKAFLSLTQEDLQTLQVQVKKMSQIQQSQSVSGRATTIFGPDFYQADATFHKILYNHVDNMVLKSIIDAIWQCDRYHKEHVRTTYLESTVLKHEKILAALLNHDYAAFCDAMHYHFDTDYKKEST